MNTLTKQLNGFEVHNPLELNEVALKKRNGMAKDYIKLQMQLKNFNNYQIFDTYNLYYQDEYFGTKGFQFQMKLGEFTNFLLEHFKEDDCFLRKEYFRESVQFWQDNNLLYINVG